MRVCVSTALPAGESFRIQLDDPARIAQAAALVGAGHRKVVSGRTRSGDGGVNGGWHWHLAPESIEFVDAAIEVCDGCPHDLEGNPAYWIDQLGRYCPFSSEIVARER